VRLTAIEIPPAVTGGDPGLLKLGRICVMLGANDSGKSRILRAVSRALDSGYPKRAPASERPSFFVQLERSVAGWLDEEYSSPARSDLPFLKDRTLFGRGLSAPPPSNQSSRRRRCWLTRQLASDSLRAAAVPTEVGRTR